MQNAINWFEIPAADFDRATKFYTVVLGAELPVSEMMGAKMAFLPAEKGAVGGALCYGEGYTPSNEGTKVYLNGGDDLSEPLSRVEEAGGKIVLPKTKISDEIGYMAILIDTEGNQVAFHSVK